MNLERQMLHDAIDSIPDNKLDGVVKVLEGLFDIMGISLEEKQKPEENFFSLSFLEQARLEEED